MPRLLMGAALCSLLLCGCGGGNDTPSSGPSAEESPSSSSSGSGDADLPVEEGGPLTQLEPCDPPPDAVEGEVEGLVLPSDAVLTKVEEQGALIRVDAYVEQTPVQIRMFYGDAKGLELFEIEDEVVEAEVLFGSGDFRSYVKALAVCERGSNIIVFVGPGGSGELPSLGGG